MSFVLQKDRSISDVLVDTIQFVKHHYKLMLTPMLYIIIPVGILAILSQIYAYRIMSSAFAGSLDFTSNDFIMIMGFAAVFGLLAFVLFFCAMLIGMGAVRQVYEGDTADDYVSYLLRKNLLPFIGLAILYGLAYFIGFIFLIIPGIYLAFALYPSFAAFIFERKSVVESLKRGHELSKENWWFIVGAAFLMYLLMFGIDFVTDLPGSIISFILGMGTNPEAVFMQEGISAAYIIIAVLSGIGYMITFLLYALVGVHVAILYFTLRERKEGDSLADEMAEFESDLSDESADDGFGKDDGLGSDPDSDRNNPDWR